MQNTEAGAGHRYRQKTVLPSWKSPSGREDTEVDTSDYTAGWEGPRPVPGERKAGPGSALGNRVDVQGGQGRVSRQRKYCESKRYGEEHIDSGNFWKTSRLEHRKQRASCTA